MTNSTLWKHGTRSVEEILTYLKHKFEKQLEAAPIAISSMTFYPQISGEMQVEIFKYLEKQDFLSVNIKPNFMDEDGKYLYEDKEWLEGLEIFSKSTHEPFDKTSDIELMKNSYDFTINLAEDFDEKHQEFMELVENKNQIAYQLKIDNGGLNSVLYVEKPKECRKVRSLQDNNLPFKVLSRLLKPESDNQPIDISDLLNGTQTPIRLLDSVFGKTLRRLFFPETTKTSVYVRRIITLETLYKENISRKSVEEVLIKLPLYSTYVKSIYD